MKTKLMPKWVQDAINWIGDDVQFMHMVNDRTAQIRWPKDGLDYIKLNDTCKDWHFVGGGADPHYAAGYAYACGYHD